MKNRILFYLATTALVLVSINCGRNIDGLERVSQSLTGVADLGSPLSGATVTAYMFKMGERGEVLGTGTTDETGKYEIEHHHPYRGPVLLVAAHGSFVDPTTKIQMFMPEKLTLLSAIADSKEKNIANINAASTLAVAVFETPAEKERLIKFSKDSDKAESNWVGSLLDIFSWHFSRESWNFDYLTNAPWDPSKEKLGPSENRVLVYLFHAGLSQMAKDLSKTLGQEPGSIRLFDLVHALSLDASDGVMDGRHKQVQLFIDTGNQIPLDSYFLRHKLASSIQLYLNTLKESGVEVGFDGKSFAAPGGFYERISMDSSFPFPEKGYEPIPFDDTPPEITMEFGGKYAGKWYSVLAREDVVLEATAVDKGVGLKSFRVLEPVDLESTAKEKNKISVIVKTSMMPNLQAAVAACGYRGFRNDNAGIISDAPKEESACVCLEAKDFLDNVSHQIRCVTRPTPYARISHTLDYAKLGADAFANQEKIKIEGAIEGGWDLFSCSWHVTTLAGLTEVAGVQLPWGHGSIENGRCKIDDKLDKEKLPDGNYRVMLIGEDLLGRETDIDTSSKDTCSQPFEVYQTPPVLEITFPEAEIRTNSSRIDLIGSVKSGIAIREVYVEMVQGQWHDAKQKRVYYGAAADGRWMLHIEELPEAVAYTYVVHAVDIYGNRSQLAPRLIVVDRTPPTIKGHREGIAQGSYAQERSTVSVLRSGVPGTPHFQFKPNGTQIRIPWDNIPVLYRWANLIGEENTAPGYQIEVKDDGGIKEVRWAHGDKCADLSEAVSVAQLNGGKATLFLNSASSLDKLDMATDDSKLRCISVWAVDKAGNTQNQQISFKWRTVAPPIVVDFNSPLYDPTKSEDDMVFSKHQIQDVYTLAEHTKDKDGYVVAHALLHNPHNLDLDFKMDDNSTSSIELKLKEVVVLGKESVVRDWVYHGTTEERESRGTPAVPNANWGLDRQRYRSMNSSEGLGVLMHPSGPSGNPTKITNVPVYELLSNPKSPSNLFGSMKDCSKRQPGYSKICAANEIVVFGAREPSAGNQCSKQVVECFPASHHFGVVNKRDKSVSVVGEQVVTKQSTIVRVVPRYFSFDPVTKQVQAEIVVPKDVLKIPKGKTFLVKWYLAEQNIQVGLKSLNEVLPNTKFVGECKQILYSKGNAETCDKAECTLDQVCFSLDGVQLRLTPKMSALKKGVGILSATKQSPFKYSTQTESGAVSDEQVPVVLESPISRLVTQ